MQKIDSLGFSFSISPKRKSLKGNKKVEKWLLKAEKMVASHIEKQLTPEVLFHIQMGFPYYFDKSCNIVLVGGAHDVRAN